MGMVLIAGNNFVSKRFYPLKFFEQKVREYGRTYRPYDHKIRWKSDALLSESDPALAAARNLARAKRDYKAAKRNGTRKRAAASHQRSASRNGDKALSPIQWAVRNGLTKKAHKARYSWKEDLCAIREREAADAKRSRRHKKGAHP